MDKWQSLPKVEAMEVKSRSISELLTAMGKTAYQGRTLAEATDVWEAMLGASDLAIVMGLAGSMSTAGQWKLVHWLVEHRFVDVLVSTGANITEDILEAMGFPYRQGSAQVNDAELLSADLNRYYDVYGKETEYRQMEDLLTEFMFELPEGTRFSSMELLHRLGLWLDARGINSILAAAARSAVPVFSPALFDSAFGEAYFMAKNRGRHIVVDQGREFDQFISIGAHVGEVGVVYIGGGVPKDFTQLMAISLSPRFEDEAVPGRHGFRRKSLKEYYYPHRFAIQITTDSPQWGGLSGCTLDEAISWGKVLAEGRHVTCYCDATIALPIITHALAERLTQRPNTPDMDWLFQGQE